MGYVVEDRIRRQLYVVTVLFNSRRFKSRWKLYERFAKHVADAGAVLYTVECAFGEREHAADHLSLHDTLANCAVIDTYGHRQDDESTSVDDLLRHRYVRVRTKHEIWIKENLINLGVRHLPPEARYIAWVDCDVRFLRDNWVGSTIHALQHYAFLQMFSHAVDLDPHSEMLRTRSRHQESFGSAYLSGKPLPTGDYYYPSARQGVWSGLAWACRRDAWNAVGGLIDAAAHGGGDWHTAFALIGRAKDGMRNDLHENYRRRVLLWEERAERFVRRNVGVLEGTVVHYWHGKKEDRRYKERHKLLADLRFDPDRDLSYDAQGVLQLVDHGDERSIRLRDALREHAALRNEDATEV